MFQKLYRKLFMLALFCPGSALAAGSGPPLPFEEPLVKVAKALGGPVAFSIAVIALTAAGAVLVFGGEWNEFAKRACLLVLAISFLVSSTAFMTILFGVSGALI